MTFTEDNAKELFAWLWPERCYHEPYDSAVRYPKGYTVFYGCKHCKKSYSPKCNSDLEHPGAQELLDMMEGAGKKELAVSLCIIDNKWWSCVSRAFAPNEKLYGAYGPAPAAAFLNALWEYMKREKK